MDSMLETVTLSRTESLAKKDHQKPYPAIKTPTTNIHPIVSSDIASLTTTHRAEEVLPLKIYTILTVWEARKPGAGEGAKTDRVELIVLD